MYGCMCIYVFVHIAVHYFAFPSSELPTFPHDTSCAIAVNVTQSP